MACWTIKDLFGHLGHNVMLRYYGDIKDPSSVTLECQDCQEVVLEFHESPDGTLHLGPRDDPHEIHGPISETVPSEGAPRQLSLPVNLMFDAEVFEGSPVEQSHKAVELINQCLQVHTSSLGAQLSPDLTGVQHESERPRKKQRHLSGGRRHPERSGKRGRAGR